MAAAAVAFASVAAAEQAAAVGGGIQRQPRHCCGVRCRSPGPPLLLSSSVARGSAGAWTWPRGQQRPTLRCRSAVRCRSARMTSISNCATSNAGLLPSGGLLPPPCSPSCGAPQRCMHMRGIREPGILW